MKKVISIFLTIIMFFTALEIIATYAIRNILSSDAMQELIKETNVTEIIEEVKEDGELDFVYQEAEKYGVSEDKVDEVLASEEAKEYYGTILQKYLDGTDITLDEDTQKLLDIATEKYNIDLTEDQKEELKENINEVVIVSKKENVNNELSTNINKYTNFVKNNALYIIAIVSLIVQILLIVILNIKKRNFMSYFAVCLLFLAIFMGLCTFGLQIVLAILNQSVNINLVKLFGSILQKGYIFSLVLFVLMIIFFIINKKIKINGSMEKENEH